MGTPIQTSHILSLAPNWVPDEKATKCKVCDAPFSMFTRKVPISKIINHKHNFKVFYCINSTIVGIVEM